MLTTKMFNYTNGCLSAFISDLAGVEPDKFEKVPKEIEVKSDLTGKVKKFVYCEPLYCPDGPDDEELCGWLYYAEDKTLITKNGKLMCLKLYND